MISTRFEIPGLSGAWTISRPESVTAVLNFRRIDIGFVDDAHDPLRVPG